MSHAPSPEIHWRTGSLRPCFVALGPPRRLRDHILLTWPCHPPFPEPLLFWTTVAAVAALLDLQANKDVAPSEPACGLHPHGSLYQCSVSTDDGFLGAFGNIGLHAPCAS